MSNNRGTVNRTDKGAGACLSVLAQSLLAKKYFLGGKSEIASDVKITLTLKHSRD